MLVNFFKKTQSLKNKQMLSGGIVYLIFSLSNQIIGLLFTSILTSTFSLAVYGEYSLIITVQSILFVVLTLSISSGFSRFYNEVKSKLKLLNSVIIFLLLFSILIFPLIFYLSDALSALLLNSIELGSIYVIKISVIAIFLGISSVYETAYAMNFQPVKACLINFVSNLLRVLVVLFFVKFETINIDLILNAQIIISFLVVLLLFFFNIEHFKEGIDLDILKPVLKFGLGLMLGGISVWIITLIDRRFLAEYSGFEDVAVYSLASTIGMLITPVFLLPFRKLFTPFKLKVYNEPNGKQKIQCFYEIYCFLGIFCVLGLSLYSEFLVSLIGSLDYLAAVNIIPLIALSYFLWGLNEFYGLGLIIGNKSLTNSLLVMITAIINVLLNFMLIPEYGMWGAASSTIFSYLITNLLYFNYSKQYFCSGVKFFGWIKYAVIYALIYSIYLVLNLGVIINFFVSILLLIIYIGVCFKINFINKSHFKRVNI